MKKRKLFLRWSLLPSLTMVGAIVMASLGWFGMMYTSDATHLSQVILLIFVAATVWAGRLSWRLSNCQDASEYQCAAASECRDDVLKRIESDAEHGTFAQDICERLGLLGTVFGFVIMLIGGFDVSAGDPQAIQGLLGRISGGMSTAFITTLVGYACSILLRIQYHFLTRYIERVRT